MKTEKVDKRYVIRLTESEAKVLEKRFALSGMSSVSAYLRQQVVNGIYLEYDHEELKKIRQAVMRVANNINQIAHRVNSTSRIYKQEFDALLMLLNPINSILYKFDKWFTGQILGIVCRNDTADFSLAIGVNPYSRLNAVL